MKTLYFCFFWTIILGSFSSFGWAEDRTGTLVVTYQTGIKGERLERVRFWLRRSDRDKQLHPANHASVEDSDKLSRTVVIENLKPGDYTLEFIIPNRDSFFYSPEVKQVKILPGQITKVNQSLRPRYASLVAKVEAEDFAPFAKFPLISLHTASGQMVDHSSDGSLNVYSLEPGCYTVLFEELKGYICPQPIEIVLQPGEKADSIVGLYLSQSTKVSQIADFQEEEVGTLLLFYSLTTSENSESLKYRLKDKEGDILLDKNLTNATCYRLKSGFLAVLRNLTVGQYELEFYLDEKTFPPKVLSRKSFEIKKGEMQSLQVAFSSEEVAAFKAALSLHREMERREKELAFVNNPKAMQPAFLTIKCERSDASWDLYRRSMLIYSGTGSVNRLKVPPGGPYIIKPAKKEGRKAKLSPQVPFFLEATKGFQVDILYESSFAKESLLPPFSSPIAWSHLEPNQANQLYPAPEFALRLDAL